MKGIHDALRKKEDQPPLGYSGKYSLSCAVL